MKLNQLVMFFLCAVLPTQLKALDPSRFYQRFFSPTPAWMEEQIEKDLAPFTTELSKQCLDDLFAKEGEYLYFFRVRVENGNISVQKSNNAARHSVPDLIIEGINKLHKIAPFPDIDLIFTSHDTICSPDLPPRPIFVESKCKEDLGLILFPDRFSLRDYAPEKQLVLEGNLLYPWEAKSKILFFRGSDTGTIFDPVLWWYCPRPTLVKFSIHYPEVIDAKFANSLHYKDMVETARQLGYIANFVTMKDHIRYLSD